VSLASPSITTSPPGALQLQRQFEHRAQWRSISRSRLLFAVVGLLAIVLVIAAVLRLSEQAAYVLDLFGAHPFALLIAASAIGWLQVQQARRRSAQTFARSWLASAPIDAREIAAAVRRNVAARVLSVLVAMIAVPIIAGLASGTSALLVIAILAAGVAIGSLAGWLRPVSAKADVSPHGTRLLRTRRVASIEADFGALARWPFAQMLAQTDARLHARMLAAILLTMPMGTPLYSALLVVLLAASATAAHGLLQALLAVIAQAAGFLRCTPLPMTRFLRLVCVRAFAGLCTAALLIATLVWALGGSARSACAVAGALIAWSITATASALACRYHAERARVERWTLGLLLLAVGIAAPAVLCLVLPPIWWWSWQRAAAA